MCIVIVIVKNVCFRQFASQFSSIEEKESTQKQRVLYPS